MTPKIDPKVEAMIASWAELRADRKWAGYADDQLVVLLDAKIISAEDFERAIVAKLRYAKAATVIEYVQKQWITPELARTALDAQAELKREFRGI